VERASKRPVPFRIVDRRPGDAAEVYADATLARQLLKWSAHYDLDEMCRDAWQWHAGNPHGYSEAETAGGEMAVVA
jgi:UDP-glucose 4-epimerase